MSAGAGAPARRRPWLLALLLVGAHIIVAALLVMVDLCAIALAFLHAPAAVAGG